MGYKCSKIYKKRGKGGMNEYFHIFAFALFQCDASSLFENYSSHENKKALKNLSYIHFLSKIFFMIKCT